MTVNDDFTSILYNDLQTYDPYDIWKTSIGIKVKQLYYKNKYIGLIPAGLLSIYDIYINNRLRFGYKKQEYPIVRAQAALSLINLYKKGDNLEYLEYAKKHIDWLLNNYCAGYSGHCWGAGFRIVISSKIFYDSNTPFSTITPYVLEALYEYYLITKDSDVLLIIGSIFEFYEGDIETIEENEAILITSYGPSRDRVVTNAISYTMFAYSIFYNLLDEKEYIKNKIIKMSNFIVLVQREDGSWLYAPYDENSFIDCFHSAFILKNLLKTLKNVDIQLGNQVIEKGYSYIKTNFYDTENGLFKRFSISNKPSLTKFDLYDNAEMLYLSKLIGDLKLSEKLEDSIEQFHNYKDIFSVIEVLGMKKNKNTFRWAVMPYLLARSS